MTICPRYGLLTVAATLASSLLIVAPLATAMPPGCDWNTDRGTQACLGGGPFDAGKDGNGDTYGPTGEAGFLQDNRRLFPRARDADIIQLGRNICKGLSKGMSPSSIEAALIREGIHQMTAGTVVGITDQMAAGSVVISAQMFLCRSPRP